MENKEVKRMKQSDCEIYGQNKSKQGVPRAKKAKDDHYADK